jgi:CheY-like chemotaxis protein
LTREHSDVPIIVMMGQTGQFKPALASGATALMEKPLDAQQLLQTIQVLLSNPKEYSLCRPVGTFCNTAA